MASTLLPITQTQALAPVTDVLDLLFESDGVITKDNGEDFQNQHAFHTSPDFSSFGHDLGELLGITDNFTDNILEPNLTLTTPDTEFLQCAFTDSYPLSCSPKQELLPNHELDHNYTAQPLPSPSSRSSINESDEQLSPQSFTSTCSDATSGDMSPGVHQQNSPLGTGIEDMDIKSCLFEDKDLLNILTTDSTLSVNVDMDDGSNSDSPFTDLDAFLQTCEDENQEPSLTYENHGGLPFTVTDCNPDITHQSTKFPELRLSDEEKSLLAREGVTLPTNMPLTKEEERALKAVRRKIRNKISAKESRKRKQGYVEGLEKRVKVATVQNLQLQKKVETLEKQNVTLLSQLKKLQQMISSSTNKPAQTGTCVMVLLLSFALLVVPNFNPFGSEQSPPIPGAEKHVPVSGYSRSLLEEADSTTTATESFVSYSADQTDPSVAQYQAEIQSESDHGPKPMHFNEPDSSHNAKTSQIQAFNANIDNTNTTSDMNRAENVSDSDKVNEDQNKSENNETVVQEKRDVFDDPNTEEGRKLNENANKSDRHVIVNVEERSVKSDDL